MIKLTNEQIQLKKQFISDYIKSSNSADGSKLDANANVDSKNIATMESEINKDINIQINRSLIKDKIENLFDEETANKYIEMLNNHEIYCHDESSLKPYCTSVSMYPFMLNGLTELGGESKAPEHLESYCGSFVNLVFAISSQFAGAVATVEFLLNFDYFSRKDYGNGYLETDKYAINNHLQHVVYALNQPASARNYQCVFWNLSIFDKYYFESIFGGYVYPDGSKPNWETIDKLQKHFMKWFNIERTKALLTFPVVTFAGLTDKITKTMKDKDYEDFITGELAEGNSFFLFLDENAHSLSSCCRLRNYVKDQLNEFSYSLGAGGVMTGSMNVITMNMNRIIQNAVRNGKDLFDEIRYYTMMIHKFQSAFKHLFEEYENAELLPVYDAGFISMKKQFLTVGINGLVESAEFLGYDISNNDEYKQYAENIMKTISSENKIGNKLYNCKFNTEMVPAENLGVKHSKWDKRDGYKVNRDCYNSYMYLVENDSSILDNITLHGKQFMKYLDGGSAIHINLESYPTKEAFRKLLNVNISEGCNYICFNIKVTICNKCGYIDKQTLLKCNKCGSKNVDHATRVIGYLKRVKSFSTPRQIEETLRHYTKT